MEKINSKNIIKNILTFMIIFLIINYLFNTFFSNETKKQPQGIQFQTSNKINLHGNIIAEIKNYSEKDLILKSRCPKEPLEVRYFQNGIWTEVTHSAEIKCQDEKEITIKTGQELKISFIDWSHELFTKTGEYKLLLKTGDETIESNQFRVKEQSSFMKAWTVILYQPIYNLLIFFANFLPFHDFGLAIILMTILIRTLLLVPNQKALKSQKKLQEIQPKILELQEKHKGDKEKIALETMSIYKEHKVNPFGSCLPLLIQLPILIALFYVVQHGLEANQKHLLYSFLTEIDLTKINTMFLGILDLMKIEFVFMPIIVGTLQFIQMKMAMGNKKGTNKTISPEMKTMNKTMIIAMPLMIAVFTASVPSGVGLYWASSTLYGIIQQYFVNKDSTNKNKETTVKVINNKSKKLVYKELNENRKKNSSNYDASNISGKK